MGAVLDYLRIARAQTAAVEGAGFPLAAWIGGAPLWTLPVFALLGVVAHFAGFGLNSVADLRYDRKDPSKADHPLVTGRVSEGAGYLFSLSMVIAGLALFLALIIAGGAGNRFVLPWLAWSGYVALGFAYNFVGKRWKPGAVLEISGAFALAFLATATAWTGRASPLVWAVVAYAFAFTAFQIGICGEEKELGQPGEKNLLRRLGSSVGPGVLGAASPTLAAVVQSGTVVTGDTTPFLLTSERTWVFGIGLTLAKSLTLASVSWLLAGPYWGLVVFTLSWVILLLYTRSLLMPGPFDRPRRLRLMGAGEAGSYLLLVLALVPALWPWLWILFVILPVLWFATLNRALWSRTGSAWAPGV